MNFAINNDQFMNFDADEGDASEEWCLAPTKKKRTRTMKHSNIENPRAAKRLRIDINNCQDHPHYTRI